MNLCFITYRAKALEAILGPDRTPVGPAPDALGPSDDYRLYPELSYPGHVSYWDPIPESGFADKDQVERFVAKQFGKFRNCLPVIPDHTTAFRFLFRGDDARQRNLTEHCLNRVLRAYPWMIDIFREVTVITAPSGLDDGNVSIIVCHKIDQGSLPPPAAPALDECFIGANDSTAPPVSSMFNFNAERR